MAETAKLLLPIEPEHEPAWRAALPVARTLGRRQPAEVHLLNVIAEPLSAISGLRQEELRKTELRTLAAQYLDDDQPRQAVATIYAPVAHYVAQYARRHGVDRVVLAIRGRTASALRPGTIASEILDRAPCPVVTVAPAPAHDAPRSAVAWHSQRPPKSAFLTEPPRSAAARTDRPTTRAA